MIGWQVARKLAGGTCLAYDSSEIAPLVIAKELLYVSGKPKFNARIGLLCEPLKVGGE